MWQILILYNSLVGKHCYIDWKDNDTEPRDCPYATKSYSHIDSKGRWAIVKLKDVRQAGPSVSVDNLPRNQTTEQLRRVDRGLEEVALQHQQEIHEQSRQWRTVMFEINGCPVQMNVDILDLRRALGLPDFEIYAPYRPPVEGYQPANNVDDTIDHPVGNEDDFEGA